MFKQLAEILESVHFKNDNGCWMTKWSAIQNFKLLTCTTNGDSGLAEYHGVPVHFFKNPDGTFTVREDT